MFFHIMLEIFLSISAEYDFISYIYHAEQRNKIITPTINNN